MDLTTLCILFIVLFKTSLETITSMGFGDEPLSLIPLGPIEPPPLADLLFTLSTLQRKPTCYRSAAASLIHHCKGLETDIPDPERVHFAVQLTICDLDLIQQTPSVCRIETQWKACVNALASKENWWTTFSGNLHEVTNVCWIGRREVEKGHFCYLPALIMADQILELHTNLTVVQAKVLEILNTQFSEAKKREMQQREVQKKWTEFTISLEESLEIISANTTTLLQELFIGLLRVQELTRKSTIFLSGEFQTLEEDARNIRSQIGRVNNDVGTLASTGTAKIEELAGAGEQQLSLVESNHQYLMILDSSCVECSVPRWCDSYL
jgi:hypothetical protein